MLVTLIRHGKTKGNLENRYVGTTEEGILEEEINYIKSRKLELEKTVMHVYCSPMKRCMETSSLMYPQIAHTICQDLRECDFGKFEYLNYMDLEGNVAYQTWIDSNGTLAFPEGERVASFKKRCIKEFEHILADASKMHYTSVACVVHGGTIMAIMEAFAGSNKSYFDWQVDNLCGYRTEVYSNHGKEKVVMASYQKIERE